MTVKVRYEARIDAYEWLVMINGRLIETGFSRASAQHAEQEAANWIEYASLMGKI